MNELNGYKVIYFWSELDVFGVVFISEKVPCNTDIPLDISLYNFESEHNTFNGVLVYFTLTVL